MPRSVKTALAVLTDRVLAFLFCAQTDNTEKVGFGTIKDSEGRGEKGMLTTLMLAVPGEAELEARLPALIWFFRRDDIPEEAGK